jgi:hypothetical protein
VYQATRTVALLPESKEGFIPPPHHHNSTLLLFLFGFLLGFFLSSHKHLLLGFQRVGLLSMRSSKTRTQAREA